MASQSQQDTLPIAVVFTRLFHNLPRLMLTNLLFAVPLAAFTALFWLLGSLVQDNPTASNLLLFFAVVPVFPFYAGVVKVTSKMAMGEEKTPVLRTFVSGVRENIPAFLLHGAVLYVITVFSYVSISLYIQLIAVNPVFAGPLIITILIILLFLFMFFYIPAMTVTFDIPLKYIYKNSFLMAYGELKKNFIGLLGLFFLTVVSMTCLMACYGSPVAVVIVTMILAAVFVPSIASFIVHAAVYARMCEMITDKSVQVQSVNAKIREKQPPNAAQSRGEYLKTVRAFELDPSVPDDEYVYFNGKMVKAGTVKKLKQEAAEGGE